MALGIVSAAGRHVPNRAVPSDAAYAPTARSRWLPRSTWRDVGYAQIRWSLLAESELVNAGLSFAEESLAASQVLHVALVDLFGLCGDGLITVLH